MERTDNQSGIWPLGASRREIVFFCDYTVLHTVRNSYSNDSYVRLIIRRNITQYLSYSHISSAVASKNALKASKRQRSHRHINYTEKGSPSTIMAGHRCAPTASVFTYPFDHILTDLSAKKARGRRCPRRRTQRNRPGVRWRGGC